MKKLILLLLLMCSNFTSVNSNYEVVESFETFEITLDEFVVHGDVYDVQPLMEYVPDSLEREFCQILRDFSRSRKFDWRIILLVLYQESKLNPRSVGTHLKSYVGLAMFGSIARKELGVTRSEVLAMNHVEQAKLAIEMWKITERQRKTTIDGFLALHVANFYPAWLPHINKGGVLPSNDKVKKFNYPLLMGNDEFTCKGLLTFYKNKIKREPNLKFFRDKI